MVLFLTAECTEFTEGLELRMDEDQSLLFGEDGALLRQGSGGVNMKVCLGSAACRAVPPYLWGFEEEED